MKMLNGKARWWAMAVLVSVACGPHGAALSQSDLHVKIEQLAAQKDTVGLADVAESQCESLSGEKRMSCYEDFFSKLSSKNHVKVALGSLAELAAKKPDIELMAHGIAHVIGILSWKPGDDVNAAFRNCSVLFQSGCYHGVVQAYLTSLHVDSAVTVQLCDKIAPNADDRWLRFQCVHGLGHGLEMVNNWDLPTSLHDCDWLNSQWDQASCYGGVFMENAVASTPGGHHTSATALAVASNAASADSADARGGMAGMAGMAGMDLKDSSGAAPHMHSHAPDPKTIKFKMRDDKDPLYPCSVIAAKYVGSCYQNQGGILLAAVGSDFKKAAEACDKAIPAARSECYLSLGTNASGMTARNTPKAIAYCSNGDPNYQPNCFVGVVKNYIDVTANPDDGLAFCKEVPKGSNWTHCYVAVGQQISILWPSDQKKKSDACAKAGDGAAECRLGAGLQ